MSELKPYHHGDLKNALIQAGSEILAKEGAGSLSLRKVAKRAGVSHTAPYAHFADKQALIAAISTQGFRRLYALTGVTAAECAGDPPRLLVETAWAYLQFARHDPDQFKIMFSSVLEKEKDYPDYVAAAQENFQQVVAVVEACQAAGVLRSGPAEVMAVSVWGAVHGLIMLMLEGQIAHAVLERFPGSEEQRLRQMLVFTLGQFSLVPLVDVNETGKFDGRN